MDGLYGERDIAIADLVNVAIGGCDADAEIFGIGLGELGNVVGDGTTAIARDFGMAALQKTQQRRLENLIPASSRTDRHIRTRVHAFPLARLT